MNYITRLQADLASAQAEAAAKAEAMLDFRIHLASDKFTGHDPDGSRRDWIAVGDVYAWLSHIAAAGA
jgi:hypothetical protein